MIPIKTIKHLSVILVGLCLSSLSTADVLGKWTTIDDETNEPKSVVELYEENNKVYGKVVDLITKPKDSVCEECKGKLKDQPVIGMVIVDGLKKSDDVYKGGKILDPGNGKFYKAKIWREGENLQVRGYLGPFYRTQAWLPFNEPVQQAAEEENSEKKSAGATASESDIQPEAVPE